MNSGQYPDLGLTNDEVVARYLRHIADGPECAAYLRNCKHGDKPVGFESWCAMWRASHKEQTTDRPGLPGCRSLEWDSRNYTDADMREIYDSIIMHASRSEAST